MNQTEAAQPDQRLPWHAPPAVPPEAAAAREAVPAAVADTGRIRVGAAFRLLPPR